ncbi:soluble NSF attachment family protein [Amycolatopsis sp. FU40]|uniref:soluble NSF attachment family protein n=1 Tax=Amycolatopsis sp. FU40 TaxID=2914159 RepID=UPI001F34B1D9|nr:soluble NSF attachment family protein [Amycolatopsis sp. FU40]UKD58923.1 soluble NSF attachment family protein [Amycolatopsis sp. FU40]
MAAPTEQELWSRLWSSRSLPFGKGQIAETESLVRAADAEGTPELRYAARISLIRAYNQGDEPAKAFVPFAWCLAKRDQGEGDEDWDHSLFWSFKAAVAALADFPEVPLDRTYAVLDDMERRYRAAGHTMNPVHQHRQLVARHVGDHETAAEQYRLWNAAPRGEMSDCIGCEPSEKVAYLSRYGRFEEAVAVAEPVVGGTFTCTEQPNAILSALLLPYVRTGRLEEAASAHRQAYRTIRHNRLNVYLIPHHLRFCARTGNHVRGLEILERHLGWLDEAPSPFVEMEFCAAAALNLRLVAESGHGGTAVRRPGGESSVQALHDELSERALGIAARFDARNGTGEQSDLVSAVLAAEPIVDHLPLSLTSPRPASPPRKSAAPSLPDTPEELADLAEKHLRRSEDAAAEAVWAKFDELCPEPAGSLLARRLSGSASSSVDADPEAAERDWLRAAELFAAEGDEVARHAAASKAGFVRHQLGEPEAALVALSGAAEALAGLGDQEQHVRALLRWSMALAATDDLDAAFEILGRADAAVAAEVPADLTARLLLLRGELTARSGRLDEAREPAGRAAELFAEAGFADQAAWARLMAGRMTAATGDLETAYATVRRAESAVTPGLRAQVRHTLGLLASDLDLPEEAADHYRGEVADLAEAGDVTGAALAQLGLAAAAGRAGDALTAADAAESAIEVLEKGGDEDELARARYLLAGAHRTLSQRDPALALLEQVLGHFAAAGNEPAAGQAAETIGDILDELDRDGEAAESYQRAAEHFRTAEIPVDTVRNLRQAALSWQWAKGSDQALSVLAEAEKSAADLEGDEPPVLWERAMVALNGGKLLASAEQPGQALIRATAAVELFLALGATTEAAIAAGLRAQLLVELGRPAEARAATEAAIEGLPPEATEQIERLEYLLANLDEE